MPWRLVEASRQERKRKELSKPSVCVKRTCSVRGA